MHLCPAWATSVPWQMAHPPHTRSQLHQLQVHKLLQCRDLVVCPEGLNCQMEASHFTFKELPLWNTAAPTEPAFEPQLMVVDLGGMHSEGITATIQTPLSMPVLPPPPAGTTEPSGDATATVNLQLTGTMELLQQASSITQASVSWDSTPRKQPPSAALGAPPAAEELEDPFRAEETDTVISVPAAIFTPMILIMMQMPLQAPIPTGALSSSHVTPQTLEPILPKTPQVMSLPFITWPQAPTKGRPIGFPDELLQLQERMNVALEWLLTNRAPWTPDAASGTIKHLQKPLGWLCELVHPSPWDTPLPTADPYWWCALNCHPGDVSHHPAAGCSRQRVGTSTSYSRCWGLQCHKPVENASATPLTEGHPSKETETGWRGDSWQWWSTRRMPLQEKQGGKGPEGGLLQEVNIIKVARWVYQKAHQANFEQEGSYDLSSISCQMATSTNLLNAEVYKLQETWGGWKDLRTTNLAARASPKDIHFFQIISPMELPKIMGLKSIHSMEALQWQGRLTFCPCAAKRVKMREWWWITCGPCTTILTSSVPTAWATSPPMQRQYVAMPMVTNPQLLAPGMMMTERKKTMKMIMMLRRWWRWRVWV